MLFGTFCDGFTGCLVTQKTANDLSTIPRVPFAIAKSLHQPRLSFGIFIVRQPFCEARTFFECFQRRPERVLELVIERADHAVGRKSMSDATAITDEIAFFDLPQHTAAVRAGKCRRRARPIIL